jgi:hypothetical protein
MLEAQGFAVNPIEAIELIRGKLRMPTRMWTDIWQGMHARAFVVAGAQSDGLVADFHDAVTRAIAEGRTLEDFRKDFDRIVAEHGWSYRGTRNWRSRVIFETNMRMSYSSGRWAQAQRVKRTRPFVRYVHVDPMLTQKFSRPDHAALHDLVLHIDDPFWDYYWPPNGWGCRCFVQSLSERDLKRYGLSVSESPKIEWLDRTINTANGPVTIKVPKGIAPGFAYNPGKAGFGRGAQSLAMERHGPWTELTAPGSELQMLAPLPLDRASRAIVRGEPAIAEDELRKSLREALDGDEAIVADPTDTRVRITQAIVDHMLEDRSRLDGRERFFPLLRELIEDPAEIWMGFAKSSESGRTGIRRRYVKLIDIGGGRTIGLIADVDGGEWSGLTFFRGRRLAAANLRSGLLIFRREK